MTQLVTQPKASDQLAVRLGIDRQAMLETFKAQCFRNANTVSDAQLAAFVSIANDMGVNPLLPGMLYAYPTTGGGIVPMMGPDGVYKKLMEHPAVEAWDTKVFPEDPEKPVTHATTTIYLKGKDHVISYTAYLGEWKVGSNPNWNSRPRHMLGLRSLKQAARQVIHGLPYDEDDKVIGDLINVTGTSQAAPEEAPAAAPRPEAPKKARGVAASKAAAAAATVVEAEIVPPAGAPVSEPTPEPKPVGAPAATAPAIEVQAEPAPTQPAPVEAKPQPVVEKPAAPVPEKKPEPVKAAPAQKTAEKPAAAQPVQVVTSLTENQRMTFEKVEVMQFAKKSINGQPSIEAELKGAFTGRVYHIGGAENPAWQIEAPVIVTLSGKKLKDGRVITLVEKVEVNSGGESVELF